MNTNEQQDKEIAVIRMAKNPIMLEAMYAAGTQVELSTHFSDWSKRRSSLIDFLLRMTDEADLRRMENERRSIGLGHATTKHFGVAKTILLEQGDEGWPALVPGMKLTLVGHGWVNPAPGKFLQPFEVWKDKERLGEVDIDHAELSKLIDAGALIPLP